MTGSFYFHGRVACRACFPESSSIEWYKSWRDFGSKPIDAWRLTWSPGYWGSRDPQVLVCGFSKGTNQMKPSLAFDDIPFAGGRRAVTTILTTLGLLTPGDTVDRHLVRQDGRFGFCSLVRCSLGTWNERTQRYESSGGNILTKATSDLSEAGRIIDRCVEAAFRVLPAGLRLVVMFGNDDRYVEQCLERFRRVHSDIAPVENSNMAYGNRRVRWVHTVHFKAQGGLVDEWAGIRPCSHSQPRKRDLAIRAVREVNPLLS